MTQPDPCALCGSQVTIDAAIRDWNAVNEMDAKG